jgi:thymidine phosphorylase
LAAATGDTITVEHAPNLDSLSAIRSKIYGHRLDAHALDAIFGDVAAGHYSDLHIAAFLSACAGGRMVERENGCLVWGGALSLSPAAKVRSDEDAVRL